MVWPQAIGMRLIGVGAVGKLRLDEMLARHLVHRAQHRLVADAALAQRQHELHALFAFVGRQPSVRPLIGNSPASLVRNG